MRKSSRIKQLEHPPSVHYSTIIALAEEFIPRTKKNRPSDEEEAEAAAQQEIDETAAAAAKEQAKQAKKARKAQHDA